MRKSKEEDRIEKIIRGLLKLPENRRCINCNSLGPQYVCTPFWTFICTNCSGVHREFTHRVKSVSMAKFSSEEVSALQAGGNERAREVYFKTWDLQRHSFPDSSNLHRLRDFIKNVYVDRKYTGARHPALIPRSKMSERDGPYERRSNNAVSESHGLCERNDERHSRFCDDRNSRYSSNDKNIRYCYDDRTSKYSYDRNGRHLYDDRNNRHSYDEGRSPSYSRDSSLSGGLRRSCSLFEVTSERHHDEDPRTPKTPKTPTEMFTTNDINPRRSNYRQKDKDISSPPPIRPVRDILGESFARLRAEDSPKLSDKRSVDGSVHAWVSDHSRSTYTKSTSGSSSIEQTGDSSKTTIKGCVDGSSCSQKTAPSSSEASGKGDAEKCTPTKSQSLIDFPANPSPLDSSVSQETQQTAMLNDAGNSASLESPAKEKPSPAPPKNTLEFLLFELSTPADASADKEFRDSSSDSAVTMAPPTCTPVSTRISHTTPKGQVLALPSTSITPSTILCPAAGGLRVAPTSSGSTASASTVAHLLALPAPVSSTSTPTSNPTGDEPKTLTIEMSQDPQDDSGGSTNEEANRHQFPSMHLAQHAANSVPCSQTLSQQTFPSSGVAKNPSGIFSSAPISQEHPGLASAQSCQSLSNPAQPQGGTRLSSLEPKSSERKELPADIFTSLYPSVPQPMPGWQMGPNYGMGFNMQYGPSSMQVQAFPNAAKSTNPFDISDDTTELQTSVFPSMASLQGLLPNVSAPSGRPPISSFGSDPTGTQSPSFMTGMDRRSPVYGTVASPGAFMGQHLYMPPFWPQGVGDFSNGETSGLLNQNHQAEFQYSSSTNPSSFPRGGGNPFG